MTTPSIVPTQYQEDDTDYLNVKCDRSGAARTYAGTVTIPSGTVATTVVGLTPFNKGARFSIGDKSIYCSNFGAGTTTVSIGYVYDDNVTYTNDVDAWASAATAPQSGGFVTVDEPEGVIFIAEDNGWIAATINTADADAEGTITFNFTGSYDGLGVNNSNNQS